MMRAVLSVLALFVITLSGCIGDDTPPVVGEGDDAVDARLVPTFPNPQPDVVTGFDEVSRLMRGDEPFPSGSGNFVLGDYVYGSALGEGFFIADISDPENPVIVFDANETEQPYARKAEVLVHPDGRLTLVLASQNEGMYLWNVTDPTAPKFAAVITELDPNHNIAVVPGTEYVFNNPSRGADSTNELVDISDPENPVIVGTFSEFGCHGTTFRGTFGDDDFRAYCAAIDRTEIWDMSGLNVSQPDLGIKLLGVVDTTEGNSPVTGNPAFARSPLRTLHHLAMSNEDGTILIIGDEHNGGGSPGTCFYNDGTHSTPFGALWFYDISDESNPELLSWLSPPTVMPRAPSLPPSNPTDPNAWTRGAYSAVPNCTAHFGTIVPGEEKLVMAWYSAGVLLVDFTDPTAPTILDQFQPEGVNVWNARVHNGYVFTGDMNRGLDVIRLV